MLSFNIPLFFAFLTPGPMEMVIIAMIALLLFGKRLPEVARNFGRSMVEFKKGMRTIEDEVDSTKQTVDEAADAEAEAELSHSDEPVAPKFEPPPADESKEAPQDESQNKSVKT